MAALAELNRAPPYTRPTSPFKTKQLADTATRNAATPYEDDEEDWAALEAAAQEEAGEEDVDMDVLREMEEEEEAQRRADFAAKANNTHTGHPTLVRAGASSQRPRMVLEEEDDFGAFGDEAVTDSLRPASNSSSRHLLSFRKGLCRR